MASITITNSTEVSCPIADKTYPISISNWNHLKNKIDRIKQGNPLIQTLIGVLLGMAATAIFGIISIPSGNPTWNGFPIFFVYLTLVMSCCLGALAFIYSEHASKKYSIDLKSDILDDMKLLESRFIGESQDLDLNETNDT